MPIDKATVSDAGGAKYLAYEALGRLALMMQSNSVRFDYSGSALISERDWNGSLLRRYVHGPGSDAPIVWYEGTGLTDKRWLTADERGSIVAVTNGNGNAIAINAYDEYGIPAATNIGRFQYTGQAWLPEIGLYYYKARIYSPTLGRFMQTDPIGYGDGINWYNYVGSDPVNKVDPGGLSDEPVVTVTGLRIIPGPKNRYEPTEGPCLWTGSCEIAGYFYFDSLPKIAATGAGFVAVRRKPQNNTRKISDCMQKFLASKGLGGSNLGSVVFHNGDGGSLIAKAAFAHGNPAITIQNNVYVAPGQWNSFREGTSGFFEETVHSMQWDVSGAGNFVFAWALGSVAGAAFTGNPHNSPLEAQAMGMSVNLAKAYSEAGAQCGR